MQPRLLFIQQLCKKERKPGTGHARLADHDLERSSAWRYFFWKIIAMALALTCCFGLVVGIYVEPWIDICVNTLCSFLVQTQLAQRNRDKRPAIPCFVLSTRVKQYDVHAAERHIHAHRSSGSARAWQYGSRRGVGQSTGLTCCTGVQNHCAFFHVSGRPAHISSQ